jgi:uncharacterized protein (TIGR02246 family)
MFGAAVALLGVLATSGTAFPQATDEAQAVKNVVTSMVKAVNGDDVNAMLAYFSEDAKIYTRVVQAHVSKAKYTEIMTDVFKKGDLISADIRDMTVTMTDPNRAVVLGTVYLVTKTARPSGRAEYKLEKRDGRWLIVETNTK